MDKTVTNNWGEYRRLVLTELEHLHKSVDHLQSDVSACRIEIAMLKVKASMWGAIGGLIPTGTIILVNMLS